MAILPFLMACQTASADSFSSEPFLARLALSIDRASNHPECVARLASAAYPGRTSSNSAADAFTGGKKRRSGTPLAVSTINAFSQSGAQIAVLALTSSFELEDD